MDPAEMLRWARPEALLLLLLWLLWAGRTFYRWRTPGRTTRLQRDGESPWQGVIDADLLAHLSAGARPEKGVDVPDRSLLGLLLGLLVILALGGPQWRQGAESSRWLRPDTSRVVMVDLTPEFSALSAPDQQRLRTDLRQLVREFPGGETALVIVAGAAWQVVPPTEDGAALDGFLSELSADAVPVLGNRPEAGLARAIQTLRATGATNKTIIWLKAGPLPELNLSELEKSGVRLFILQVNESLSDWQRALAAPAFNVGQGWRPTGLNFLPPPQAGWIDLGPYLLLLALVVAAGRWASLRALCVLPLWFMVSTADPVWAADRPKVTPSNVDSIYAQGEAAYRSGQYDTAAALFSRLPTSDPRGHYNRGNALARSGRLQSALAAYDESLRLRPEDVSTRHNRDIVARLLKSSPPPLPPSPPPPDTSPPKDAPQTPQSPRSPQSQEAERAVEQWLRRPPGGHEGLLRRKLLQEESRRSGGGLP